MLNLGAIMTYYKLPFTYTYKEMLVKVAAGV
jgi:hypothetical protein